MMKKEKAIALVKRGLRELQLEIEQHGNGVVTAGEINQLLAFNIHLKEILEQLENDQVPAKNMRKFGMGHTIVDSWALDSKLGDLLCSAEQAYEDL